MSNRKLKIYLRDPSLPSRSGGVGCIEVQFGTFERGTCNEFQFQLSNESADFSKFDFSAPKYVASFGLEPSADNGIFAVQMVYGVAMLLLKRFQDILGRRPVWRAPILKIRIDAIHEKNAYYDAERCEILFGYFKGFDPAHEDQVTVRTALSFDIIAHELTHAVLDGLYPDLLETTTAAAAGLHEGIADLVAVFLRFTQHEMIVAAIDKDGVDLDSKLLVHIAEQFGHFIRGEARPLRCAILDAGDIDSPAPESARMNALQEPHEQGAVLVTALFLAFRTIYQLKIKDLLAASKGELNASFKQLAAKSASRLAEQFLAMVVRALDYLPPVNPTFVSFYDALILSDTAFVSDDTWHYREILTLAFRRHRIISAEQSKPKSLRKIKLEHLPECYLRHADYAEFKPSFAASLDTWLRSQTNLLRPSADIAPAMLHLPKAIPVLLGIQRAARVGNEHYRCEYIVRLKWVQSHSGRALAGQVLFFDEHGKFVELVEAIDLNPVLITERPKAQVRKSIMQLHGIIGPNSA